MLFVCLLIYTFVILFLMFQVKHDMIRYEVKLMLHLWLIVFSCLFVCFFLCSLYVSFSIVDLFQVEHDMVRYEVELMLHLCLISKREHDTIIKTLTFRFVLLLISVIISFVLADILVCLFCSFL